MKTPEELNALKEEVEAVSRKLHELTEEELAQVTGGMDVVKAGVSGGAVFLSLNDMVGELEKKQLENLEGMGALEGRALQFGKELGKDIRSSRGAEFAKLAVDAASKIDR